jgi:hypothetical protein
MEDNLDEIITAWERANPSKPSDEELQYKEYCNSLPETISPEYRRNGKNVEDRYWNLVCRIPGKAAREQWTIERLARYADGQETE